MLKRSETARVDARKLSPESLEMIEEKFEPLMETRGRQRNEKESVTPVIENVDASPVKEPESP